MQINMKRVILFVVLFLAIGLGKQCYAQKNDFWATLIRFILNLEIFSLK